MNLSDLKLNDLIKIAITVAITAALTFNIQVTITNNNYEKLVDDVQDVKETTVQVDKKVDIKFNKTIERLNQYGNLSQLNDQQLLKLAKNIYNEVR